MNRLTNNARSHTGIGIQRMVIGLCVLFMLGGPLGAVSAADPQALMRDTTDKILEHLDRSPQLRDDRAGLIKLIEREVFPLVDFEHVARLTLARHWSKASAAQRERFVGEMRKLLACTYSTAFAAYSGQQVDYLPPRWSDDRDDIEIRTRITQAGQPPLPVSYRLRQHDGGWSLYDLTVDGVSLVANYRATFGQKLRNDDLDALIADLATRSGNDCTEGQS